MNEIFIVVKHRGAIVMGVVSTPVHRIENRALYVGYPDEQANCPTF
jgi:hypothetical protein